MAPPPTIAIVPLSLDILVSHTTSLATATVGFPMTEVGKEEEPGF